MNVNVKKIISLSCSSVEVRRIAWFYFPSIFCLHPETRLNQSLVLVSLVLTFGSPSFLAIPLGLCVCWWRDFMIYLTLLILLSLFVLPRLLACLVYFKSAEVSLYFWLILSFSLVMKMMIWLHKLFFRLNWAIFFLNFDGLMIMIRIYVRICSVEADGGDWIGFLFSRKFNLWENTFKM